MCLVALEVMVLYCETIFILIWGVFGLIIQWRLILRHVKLEFFVWIVIYFADYGFNLAEPKIPGLIVYCLLWAGFWNRSHVTLSCETYRWNKKMEFRIAICQVSPIERKTNGEHFTLMTTWWNLCWNKTSLQLNTVLLSINGALGAKYLILRDSTAYGSSS